MAEYVIGVDLGGTNIKGGIVDVNGKVIASESVKTNVENRGGRVSAIYTGSDQFYAYGDLLVSQRRQNNPTTLTGGYQSLDFEGIPLIKVPSYPTGRMDFVDEAMLEYHVLKDFTAMPMAKVADADNIWVVHYSQLVCRNPYRMGSLQDLS